ncbi:response regulator transcription factor [Actinoplanes couchii]|uniref:Response regulatory domain-containing protein n=1 Tax=Actinoplanes couchii TaxID=403638 RepID=A0ABQ3X8K2_9ACTN|nr:response regulator [Actinoplanes couchii]MDR6320235.1 CheY-like chemotaxis protein [Actinoplanes couchii]GID54750.1 hypothetical protein Aco03nite_031540 [Actinoplanes couchii]
MARVLVVDDEPDVRELVAMWLRADGHEVVVAECAATALSAVERDGMADVAVVDVDLPGVDGVELAAELRRRTAGLPVVFLTVLWSGADVARLREHGHYLRKPCSPAALRQVVGELTGATR